MKGWQSSLGEERWRNGRTQANTWETFKSRGHDEQDREVTEKGRKKCHSEQVEKNQREDFGNL